MSKRVCVIGGGISGLCVAYGLLNHGIDAVLFEKNTELGGNIKTEIHNGFLIEHGPNSTLVSLELAELIQALGLFDEIAIPNKDAKKRYILRNGRLVALPVRIIQLVWSLAFSTSGKLRILAEPFIRSKSAKHESVASFFARRFGKEVVKYAVDPFVSGIYAGDPGRLSIRHAFPKLFELERDWGGIIRGAIFSRKSKSSRLLKGMPRSITFKRGMQTLTDTLGTALRDSVRLSTTVQRITKHDSERYRIQTDAGEELFDTVVISTPAHTAAEMVVDVDQGLAHVLSEIYYPPIAVVFTSFKSEQVKFDVRGFGFLVPSVEQRKILGSLWTSSVFEHRTPAESQHHLFTTFIGGSRNAELVAQEDEKLIQIALADLRSILEIDGEPEFSFTRKWEKAIPQYNIGYETVIEKVETFHAENPSMYICSNFYKGISISDCVKNAAETVEQIINRLKF